MGKVNAETLFHYTRNEGNLLSILQYGFKPNHCMEDFSTVQKELKAWIPMVCFCDIPLTRALCHMERYGNYAIGLRKEWGRGNKLNPVLYLDSEALYSGINNMLVSHSAASKLRAEQLKRVEEKYPEYFFSDSENDPFNSGGVDVSFLSKGDPQDVIIYMGDSMDHYTKNALLGYMKPYSSIDETGEDMVNYDEREWRYVSPYDNGGVFWSERAYEEWVWRGEYVEEHRVVYLHFNCDDVRYILLEKECEIFPLVKFINSVPTIGGEVVSEEQRQVLVSKILCVERLEGDF